jgi:hypothetical protein
MPLCAEQAPLGVPTMWASQPLRVEVAFKPKRANAVIQEFTYRKVYQASMVPHPARWLHMSQRLIKRLTENVIGSMATTTRGQGKGWMTLSAVRDTHM